MLTLPPPMPSQYLPPITKHGALPDSEKISSCLQLLSEVFASSTKPEDIEDGDVWDVNYERKFAIGWLSRLACNLESSLEIEEDAAKPEEDSLLERAITLLAIISGSAPADGHIRTFAFNVRSPSLHPKNEGDSDIQINLRERSIASSDHEGYNSVGVQTWGSASELVKKLISSDALPLRQNRSGQSHGRPLRVLELGAGTGLVGLAVAKYLALRASIREHAMEPQAPVEIILTDHDSTVLQNLQYNIERNVPFAGSISVSAATLDWKSFVPENPSDYSRRGHESLRVAPFDEVFDCILGADLIYEPYQAAWLHATASALLRRPLTKSPSEGPTGVSEALPRFHLVIPLRSTHSYECDSVFQVFPRLGLRGAPLLGTEDLVFASEGGRGSEPILGIIRVERIEAESGVWSQASPEAYLYFEIGWSE